MAPPKNRSAAGTAISAGANRKVQSTTSVSIRGTRVKPPYSYVLTPAAIDRIAAREGMSVRKFVEALLRSGCAVLEDGIRVTPEGRA
jgi:hypothetical protein